MQAVRKVQYTIILKMSSLRPFIFPELEACPSGDIIPDCVPALPHPGPGALLRLYTIHLRLQAAVVLLAVLVVGHACDEVAT